MLKCDIIKLINTKERLEDMKKRLSWDEYFLAQAELVAQRSSCDRAQVGAVITVDRSVIATGYNGGVAGLENCDEDGHKLEDGHCIRTVHAEMNAILQCARNGHAMNGATIYVTHYPCLNCMKSLAQAGVKRIVYRNDYRMHAFAEEIARLKGIEIIKLERSKE